MTNQEHPFQPTRHSLLTALSIFGEEVVRQLLAVRRAKGAKDVDALEAVLGDVLADGVCYNIKEMAVNGRDMLALGAKGKQVGECLNHLLSLLLAEELPNERAALLEAARAHLSV